MKEESDEEEEEEEKEGGGGDEDTGVVEKGPFKFKKLIKGKKRMKSEQRQSKIRKIK